MAHSINAKKRIRQNVKRRALNRWRKDRYRSAIKSFDDTIIHGTVDDAQAKLQAIYKLMDQIAAGGTIHKNTAARYKSRLTARLNKKRAEAV